MHWGEPTLPQSLRETLFFIGIYPIFLLFFYVVLPVGNTIEYLFARLSLSRHLPQAIKVPEEQSLSALWEYYGLDSSNSDYEFDDFVECLSTWITLLYGHRTAAELRIAGRLKDAYSEYLSKCNHSRQAPLPPGIREKFVYHARPVDALISDLRDVLPDYSYGIPH